MKFHQLLVCSVLWIFAASPLLHADPVLPYQDPIRQQIESDLSGGGGDVNTLNKALDTYHRNSRSLSGDIGILRDLNALLADMPNYPALLAAAADAYRGDFEGRRDGLREQLRPAPRSTTKDSANRLLRKIDKALGTADVATATSDQIKALGQAAARFPITSNTVRRALRAPIGLSSMVARIGALKFASSRGGITGGTNFNANQGATIGEFKGAQEEEGKGILTISAIDNGNVVRGIHLHVEDITTNTPATYPLGVGENSAFYDATLVGRRREYHFQAAAAVTNDVVPNAFLTIDFIGSNYLLGRFAFVGTNLVPVSPTDTNLTAIISEGEFQLNFNY